MSVPVPELRADRWQPLRGGLINLFKYENQEFHYAQGRLLLRGDNGSGKSRVLALQLPFLLDGEVSPSRVEPDRDPAKRLEWNLLLDRHDRRMGYTWIEFGRSVDGEPRYLTLGCGLDARKGGGAPKRWFFITPHRIGETLHLVRHDAPLNRRQLIEALEAAGEGSVYETASAYRAAVDAGLFRLGGRYRPLIDLLIQLRQPQLTRDMKEDVLSDALSEALPPVGDALVEQVAESFQGLDRDRQRTEECREMLAGVDAFREEYEQYLAAAVRRVCDHVRLSHSQFEHAAKALRRLEGELEANQSTLTRDGDQRRALKQELAACGAQIQTLRDSPEMRGKRDLDRAIQRAEECTRDESAAREDLNQAQTTRQAAEQDRATRAHALERQQERAQRQLASLEPLHQAVVPGAAAMDWRTEEIEPSRQALTAMVAQRRRAIRQLEDRNREVAAVRSRQELARDRLQRERGAAEDAAEQVARSESELAQAVSAFDNARTGWERSLVVLTPKDFTRDEPWVELLSEWLSDRTGPSPFDERLRAAIERVGHRQTSSQAGLSRERAEVDAARQALTDELATLRAGRQIEPPPRYPRSPRVPDRPGAPFWQCFDFQEGIPEGERAGWEAALEAAGLLDAWVLPDGRLAAPEDEDDFIALSDDPELERAESLAAILRVDDDASPKLEGLLLRIGRRAGAARCWMQADGQWANGPHHGRWSKSQVDYLGPRAREAARQRRIAALEAELAETETRLQSLAQRNQELEQARQRLEAERLSAPPRQPLVDGAVRLERDRDHEQDVRRRVAEVEDQVAEAVKAFTAAIDRRDRDARDLGLADDAEPEALARFAQRVDELERLAAAYWPEREAVLQAKRERAAAVERVAAAVAEVQRRAARHEEAEERARSAQAEAETLQAAVGTGVEELMRRLRAAEHRQTELEASHESLDETIRALEIERAKLEEQKVSADEKRSSASAERDRAVARMETFVGERLFEEIAPETQPERTGFSATAAVELARGMEKQLKDHPADDDHWHRLQGAIVQRFQEFGDQMGRQGLLPRLRNVDQDNVQVVRCEFQGAERSIRELSAILRDELADRERFFEEREREVIENHLIGEAAYALQERIRDGEEWVRGVNDELTQVHTSSGIQLKFDWQIGDAADEGLAAVRRMFLKTTATWSPDDRTRIAGFLHGRIQAAREADETATWSEHLRSALDYRAWHRFGILRRQDGEANWKRLTKRTFGTGSGGEKAMTLTVPLFAAAAAHYRSADPAAPRLILLDEVFAGIDTPTRARLMGLLETFDLDYLMTSQLEWGVYPTVSALAIYHLASRPGNPAVAVTRWVWNGREKLQVADHG